jgi:1,4-dihydroxy-2-naphthoate octaprenyltransferase
LITIRRLVARLPLSWQPYVLHMRLRAFPLVVGHVSAGVLLASQGSFVPRQVAQWLWAALLWSGFGHSGTLAFNSAFDRDVGDIGYLSNPPTVPRYLWLFGLVLIGLGALGAALLPLQYLLAYLLCTAMSIAYSVPHIRIKAHAGADVLNNALGYGALTIYGGWAALGRAFDPTIWTVLAGFFCLAAAAYPLTQIYQYDEDLQRGDRTLVIALGKRRSLIWSLCFTPLAFGFFLGAARLYHPTLWSWALLPAFAAWMSVLVPWAVRPKGYPEQKGMYRGLLAWALTDLAVVLALVL